MKSNYFISKLFNINYRMAIHEGNANRRLASETPNILFQLSPYQNLIPDRYKVEFVNLIGLVEITIEDSQGRLPIRMKGIQNRTAAKYIKLLFDMREYLES